MTLFGWLNDHLLRMTWLEALVGQGVAAAGLDPATRLGGSVQFFVYDVIKIFLLLSVLIFVISYVQSHFPPERTREMLGGRSGLGANTLAALLGLAAGYALARVPRFFGRALFGSLVVAPMVMPEVVMGINAFVIGARSVNPDFKIKVVWANTWFDPGKEADAAKALIDQGVDILTQHTDTTAPMQVAAERGGIAQLCRGA